MTDDRRANLLVLLSGGGRTMDNIQREIDAGSLDAQIACVVGSRACLGVDKARDRGIETHIFDGGIDAHDLDELVERHKIDWVVLAGYLKLVPITDSVRGKVVNIHPALLPDFGGPGMHGMRVHRAVAQAADKGEITETGCTVHLCDDRYDTGPIIEQRRCPVAPGDDPETIAARVFELECACFPSALRTLISDRS